MQQRRRLGSQPQCAPQHCSWRDKLTRLDGGVLMWWALWESNPQPAD